jgi:hypothetical protein
MIKKLRNQPYAPKWEQEEEKEFIGLSPESLPSSINEMYVT